MAQDVELPFTWEGKGSGTFISEYGTDEFDFTFELSVDEQGMFKGQATNEDGVSKIQHIFYSEKKEYDFPGFFSRNIVIVFILNEYGSDPMLSVLNGRVLVDKFLYGEVMLTRYEQGSDTARALGVGNPEATLMEGDELPNSLKSALKKCLPFGVVKIEGDFKAVTDSGSQDGRTIDLFNGKDFKGWHFYLENSHSDPKNVWKIINGEIYCTGNPTGFLRTQQEYSD